MLSTQSGLTFLGIYPPLLLLQFAQEIIAAVSHVQNLMAVLSLLFNCFDFSVYDVTDFAQQCNVMSGSHLQQISPSMLCYLKSQK